MGDAIEPKGNIMSYPASSLSDRGTIAAKQANGISVTKSSTKTAPFLNLGIDSHRARRRSEERRATRTNDFALTG